MRKAADPVRSGLLASAEVSSRWCHRALWPTLLQVSLKMFLMTPPKANDDDDQGRDAGDEQAVLDRGRAARSSILAKRASSRMRR